MKSFTAIRKDAGLCCGSRLRSGEVSAYGGSIQNLKDLMGSRERRCGFKKAPKHQRPLSACGRVRSYFGMAQLPQHSHLLFILHEPLQWRAKRDPKAKQMLALQSFLPKGVSLGYVEKNHNLKDLDGRACRWATLGELKPKEPQGSKSAKSLLVVHGYSKIRTRTAPRVVVLCT